VRHTRGTKYRICIRIILRPWQVGIPEKGAWENLCSSALHSGFVSESALVQVMQFGKLGDILFSFEYQFAYVRVLGPVLGVM